MTDTRSVLPATAENFDTLVLASPQPVVVDFWAAWCGPCRRLAPVFRELAAEMGHVRFVSIDVDAEPALAQRFGVTSIPTLKLFRDGQLVDSVVGSLGKAELRDRLETTRGAGASVVA